jgi:hypothetical protein
LLDRLGRFLMIGKGVTADGILSKC